MNNSLFIKHISDRVAVFFEGAVRKEEI